MRARLHSCLAAIVLICSFELFVGILPAQQEKAAALKQSIAENQKLLRQYKWTETTVVKMKGEEKSRTQKLCLYGPDGKVQKQQLSSPPTQPAPGGVKGKVIARKKEEITDYMQQAVGLVHQYVPPDKAHIDAVVAAGGLSITPSPTGATMLTLKNYVKKGDEFGISIDNANNSIRTVNVKSFLQSEKDAIAMSVTFARQSDGLSYPATIVLNAPEKKIEVTIQNSNYQRATPQGQAPAVSGAAGAPPQGIDALTGPIALYPDALVAQVLDASTNPAEVQDFSAWLKQNANLKGSELQEAASKAGFDAAFIALALFPDVIQMMAQKLDWTKQLGEAFKADAQAVSSSIQRLRQQAQAMGNLKTNEQQQVVTQKASSGEQVIVIQPANPQVVYVPQYNPQVVYVQPAPAAISQCRRRGTDRFHRRGHRWGRRTQQQQLLCRALRVASPAGGGSYAYNAAALQTSDTTTRRPCSNSDITMPATCRISGRPTTSKIPPNASRRHRQPAPRRQSAAHPVGNQSQRQTAVSGAQSQPTANQAQRQSAASGAQPQANANQAQRQSAATSSRASGQSAAQRSGEFRAVSGYQSGSAARAESQRGQSQHGGERSGGGARRR